MNKKAPLALFVYNRVKELEETIKYLKKNIQSLDTELFIFSDGPKNNIKDHLKVNKVREYLKTIRHFKKVNIYVNKKNLGLGSSIINGINKVFKFHDKVIVLEDDLITNKYFLKYMNDALNIFKDDKNIYHINGFNHPLLKNNSKVPNYFLSKIIYSWGWATWKSKWKIFSSDSEKFIIKLRSSEEFDFDNSYFFFPQLIANYRKKINSWAIFWYSSIFLKDKLSVMPKNSFVKNIGYNNQATHTKNVFQKYLIRQKNLNFRYIPVSKKILYLDYYEKIAKRYFKENSLKDIKSILIVKFFTYKIMFNNLIKIK